MSVQNSSTSSVVWLRADGACPAMNCSVVSSCNLLPVRILATTAMRLCPKMSTIAARHLECTSTATANPPVGFRVTAIVCPASACCTVSLVWSLVVETSWIAMKAPGMVLSASRATSVSLSIGLRCAFHVQHVNVRCLCVVVVAAVSGPPASA